MAETISYSKLVSIILKEVNKFRENPMTLSPILERRSQKYSEKVYYPHSDNHLQIETQEGVRPVRELISLIKMNNVFPKLNWSYELHCAANQRAEAIASDGLQSEIEELPVEHLVSSFANWNGNLSEHVLYGFCDPLEILCELLIDDGNHERENRRELMNSNMHFIGIGIHKHKQYQFVVVVMLATQVEKKSFRVQIREEGEEGSPICDGCSIF